VKVLYFSAEWCVACKTNKPMIKAVCAENNVGFEEMDADKQYENASMWGIFSLPTVLICDNKGEEMARHVGTMTKQQLIKYLYK